MNIPPKPANDDHPLAPEYLGDFDDGAWARPATLRVIVSIMAALALICLMVLFSIILVKP